MEEKIEVACEYTVAPVIEVGEDIPQSALDELSNGKGTDECD